MTDPTYANSPVLKMCGSLGAKIGWKPSFGASLVQIRRVIGWVLSAIVMSFGLFVFLTGTRLLPMPVQPGGLTAILMLIGVIAAMAFIPLAITLAIRLAFTAVFERRAGIRLGLISASVFLLIVMVWAWPRVSEVYGAMSATKANTTFATLDSKFGFGVMNNPSQFGKTGEQIEAEARSYIGATVNWKGSVTDVRDGQVLIQMRKISFKNEVVLKVGWWDDWNLHDIKRGDFIEFSGVISAVGDPFVITNGLIGLSRSMTEGEFDSAWQP